MYIDNVFAVQKYINKFKPNDEMSKEVFKKKSFEYGIAEKFITTWLDAPTKDPIDILDNMIMEYAFKLKKVEKNKELLVIYNSYIKILTNIKNYILKEIYNISICAIQGGNRHEL